LIEGVGIDIIEIGRIAESIQRPRFRERIYTEAEREYCGATASAERYAGRFAAKEAIAKALGGSLVWQEVEILCAPSGAPVPRLHGAAAARLAGRRLHVSISHCHEYAVAQAVVESNAS
jgi:holo-[acyl-carrier protein] synthase